MKGTCHCGRVAIRLAAPPPFLNACNCSLCMKLGAAWGYYAPADVEIAGTTGGYERADVERPSITVHFCNDCGATVNWSPAAHRPQGRMGINMRLFDPAELAGVEIRHGDRRRGGDAEPRPDYRAPTPYDGIGAMP